MSHIQALLTRLRSNHDEIWVGETIASAMEMALSLDGWTVPEEGRIAVLGMSIKPLPDGWRPLNTIMVIECLKMDVEDIGADSFPYGLVCRATEGLSLWSAEGMANWAMREIVHQSHEPEGS